MSRWGVVLEYVMGLMGPLVLEHLQQPRYAWRAKNTFAARGAPIFVGRDAFAPAAAANFRAREPLQQPLQKTARALAQTTYALQKKKKHMHRLK